MRRKAKKQTTAVARVFTMMDGTRFAVHNPGHGLIQVTVRNGRQEILYRHLIGPQMTHGFDNGGMPLFDIEVTR